MEENYIFDNEIVEKETDTRPVDISDEIIFEIRKVVKAVPGVSGLYKKKGIRADANGIDISVVIDFGVRIPEIAWNIQTMVKKKLLDDFQLTPNSLNIHVQGVEDVE